MVIAVGMKVCVRKTSININCSWWSSTVLEYDSGRMLLKLVTGNGERESGNECTAAVTRLSIQHGGQRKGGGNKLGKCEEVLRL